MSNTGTDQNENPDGAPPPAAVLSNAASDGSTFGWKAPPDHPRRRWQLLLGLLVLGAIVIGAPLVYLFVLDSSAPSAPDIQIIGIGTGGSGCTLTDHPSSIPVGVPVRVVLTFEPDLPAGGSASITIAKDGVELVDRRDTITTQEPAPCVHGTLFDLEAGHYRVEYTIRPTAMPPIGSEFDVVPADVASGVPTRAATPAPARVAVIGEAVVVVDPFGTKFGTATVVEVKEPAPGDILGFVPGVGNRLIVVKVRYVASAPWEINMFDWVLRDEAGQRYEPTGFGPAPIVLTQHVAQGETFEGWVGFEVPDAASVWIDHLAIDRSTVFSVDLGTSLGN